MSKLALSVIDWENLRNGIRKGNYPRGRINYAAGFEKLFTWIRSEAEEIFDTLLFAPPHITFTDYGMFYKLGLVATTCPKMPQGSTSQRDTVDGILIEKGLKWITHPALTHLCVVSGDADFMPLVRAAQARELKIMIAGLDPALARDIGHPPLSKDLAATADISPTTGQPMLHYFSPTID